MRIILFALGYFYIAVQIPRSMTMARRLFEGLTENQHGGPAGCTEIEISIIIPWWSTLEQAFPMPELHSANIVKNRTLSAIIFQFTN